MRTRVIDSGIDWVLKPEMKISYYRDKESEAYFGRRLTSSKDEGVISILSIQII